MKPKGEVNYIAIKQRKPLWIAIILILIFLMTLETLVTVKCFIELASIHKENQTLLKVIEMKDSMISDLEENCKDLFIENQNLKFGGTQ